MLILSIFLIVWQLAVMLLQIPNYIIPAPVAILKAALDNWQILGSHTLYTMCEALIGLAIAIVLSYVLAIYLDQHQTAKKYVMKVLAISQTIPVIIIAPIFLIWFGFGISSKILLVISICLFPLITNLLDGFSQVSEDYDELFAIMNINGLLKYKRLKIPGSLPYFFSGLRIAITYSISGAVAAEYVGSNHGLGMYMARSLTNFNYEMIFAITIVVIILTLLLLRLMELIQQKIMKARKYV